MAGNQNRLAKEASSYLRSAQHQPVDWHSWSGEAFEKAVREDKPILLDIGAVWCHWCHVMDHESYEDASIAQLINERFVAIKVDRDERPDVDARYQKSIQAMLGQGGWPLTAFLLPDGRVFYGGTYFPPRDMQGRPSFRRVLEAVSETYRERRQEALHNAEHLEEFLARGRGQPSQVAPHEWDLVVESAVNDMRQQFDVVNGGFGRAPKFPHPAAHDLLLERAMREDASARDMLVATLDAMAAGGIHDHIGGGWHRYSVDAEWIVPHFEKMLYDNAGLLRNYARAGAALREARYHDVAARAMAFLRDVLSGGQPGFGGSQDADVGPEDDGDFFTWTVDELREAVPDERLARLMAAHYDIHAHGEMHHNPAKNVLHTVADAEALSAAHGLSLQEIESELERGRGLMARARAKRPTPFVDPIRYTNWNGMAIQALLEYGGAFDNPSVDALALEGLDLFLERAWSPENGFARFVGSDAFGLLDDNAQMLDALLEAHFATGRGRYLDAARLVADLLLKHFPHPDGGFLDRAPGVASRAETAPLASPERPVQDAPTASPNGVILRALPRLSDATGDERYRNAAREALERLAPEAARLSLFGGSLLLALDAFAHPPPRIVLRTDDLEPYRVVARSWAKPGATLLGPDEPGLPEEARALTGEGALVCLGQRCLAPARSPKELQARLLEARRA